MAITSKPSVNNPTQVGNNKFSQILNTGLVFCLAYKQNHQANTHGRTGCV
ncbi:MAG: hypothetical protein RMX68_001945 [Aulosira sp. ZfuVER01]|nr:hypothetical protein [Aulosira sp. ZfuVER01]MDZ8001653.1 hypothetical protein [Aulosira sp. DedVER01a]MDZ8055245.1 hypothetical protein [Aulosira sp. ZfuCHP01]